MALPILAPARSAGPSDFSSDLPQDAAEKSASAAIDIMKCLANRFMEDSHLFSFVLPAKPIVEFFADSATDSLDLLHSFIFTLVTEQQAHNTKPRMDVVLSSVISISCCLTDTCD